MGRLQESLIKGFPFFVSVFHISDQGRFSHLPGPIDNDDFPLEHPVFNMFADSSFDQHGSSIHEIWGIYSPILIKLGDFIYHI